MSSYKITIPYTPKPKASVELNHKTRSWYNPSSRGMLQTREFVRKSFKEQLNEKEPLLTGPLLAIVHYKLPAPKGLPEKKRVLQNLLPHIKRPDGDNLEKFLNDALNGLLWDDDARIAWLVRSKSTTSSKEGSTTIFIKEIPLEIPKYDELIADIIEHIKIEEETS